MLARVKEEQESDDEVIIIIIEPSQFIAGKFDFKIVALRFLKIFARFS